MSDAEQKATIVKIQQNGITRPKAGTVVGGIWDFCDAKSAELGRPVKRGEAMEPLAKDGLNEATIATQYGRWRKFHGLQRTEEVKAAESAEREAAKAAAKAKKDAEKAAKAAAKEAEKAAKEAAKAEAQAKKQAEAKAKAEAKAAADAAKAAAAEAAKAAAAAKPASDVSVQPAAA